MGGEIGSADSVNRVGFNTSTKTLGPFKFEDSVCTPADAAKKVSLSNTQMGGKAFSFTMTISNPEQFSQVRIEQDPQGGITGLTVRGTDRQPTEVYSGPTLYDDLMAQTTRATKNRQWAPSSGPSASNIVVVGERPAGGELGTVTRSTANGVQTVTFTKAEATDLKRLEGLRSLAGEVLRQGANCNCQASYDAAELMAALTPRRPSDGWR